MVEVETLEVETLEELLSGQLGRLVIPKRGEVLEGAVVFSDKTGILVDVGGKSEALVSRREIPKGTDITLGEKVSILVVDPESPEGALIGSLKRARVERLWQHLSQAQKNGEVVEIEILDGVKSGLLVSFSGVKGFLPMSQTGRQVGEDLRDLHGTKALVKVLEVNKKRGRMVVSSKAVTDEKKIRERQEILKELNVGDIVRGMVTATTNYGAFIAFGGMDGLVHISEMAWERVEAVKDYVNVGDEVDARIIKIEPEFGRVSLSMKATKEDPWKALLGQIFVGQTLTGKIIRIKKYGIFLELTKGVEGLLHTSETGYEAEQLPEIYSVGNNLTARVIEIDPEQRRICFTLLPEEVPEKV